MYDFNPLLAYPLLRPWEDGVRRGMLGDRMVAPVPELILHRICDAPYHELLRVHGEEFTRWFGTVFEKYVGMVLERLPATGQQVMSESEIRTNYPERRGKAPDWCVIDGKRLVLLECKAVRYRLEVMKTGLEAALDQSLRQVIKGLIQCNRSRVVARFGRVPIQFAPQNCQRGWYSGMTGRASPTLGSA